MEGQDPESTPFKKADIKVAWKQRDHGPRDSSRSAEPRSLRTVRKHIPAGNNRRQAGGLLAFWWGPGVFLQRISGIKSLVRERVCAVTTNETPRVRRNECSIGQTTSARTELLRHRVLDNSYGDIKDVNSKV